MKPFLNQCEKLRTQQIPVVLNCSHFRSLKIKRHPPEGSSSVFSPFTCNGQPVELRVWVGLFAVGLSGDVIPEADGRQRDETEIQRLQKVPVLLQVDKDPRGDEEEQHGHEDSEAGGVDGGQLGLGHGPAAVEVGHRTSSHQHHDPLHHRGEEEEGDGDAEEGVEDTEGFPFV